MFNNQSRARALSTSTLRTLYQLAYISSGTAVGVAALCAEERRRRTVIVQKIADNATRIRQSPRHVHNAALASGENPTGWSHEDVGPWMAERGSSGDVKDTLMVNTTARGPELPSAVQSGYNQIAVKDQRKLGRRESHSTMRTIDDTDSLSSTRNFQIRSPGRYDVADKSSIRSHQRDKSLSSGFRAGKDNMRMLPSTASPPPDFTSLRNTTDGLPSSAPCVKDDVDLFLCVAPWSRRGLIQESRVADHLLSKALDCGLLAEVQSMLNWKFASGKLAPQTLQQICSACPRLMAHTNKDNVHKFYLRLFGSEAFQASSERLKTRLAINVTAEMMSWGLRLSNEDLINGLILPVISHTSPNDLHEILNGITRHLLADHQTDRAVDLIVSLSNINHPLTLPLANSALDAALNQGSLTAAGKILQWTFRHAEQSEMTASQYGRFIEACGEQKAHHLLSSILKSLAKCSRFDWLIPKLSDEAKSTLATACAAQARFPRDIFKKLFDHTPTSKDSQSFVSQYHSMLQCQELWSSTRDLTTVRKLFDKTHAFNTTSRVSGQAAEHALITMIEIVLSANQPLYAIELLSDYHTPKTDRSYVVCLAAVAMAKKKDWKNVHKLLEILKRTDAFVADEVITRQMHHLVHLISQHKTAEQSFEFATELMDNFKFQPLRSTTDSLLQCFVSHNALDLIPKWLDGLRARGIQFDMDTRVAVILLTRYYLRQRPSHVLVMWLCRQLAHLAPWLDGSKFIGLIKQSIAFDVRKSSGKNKALIQSRARMNLSRLEQFAGTELPAPIYSSTMASLSLPPPPPKIRTVSTISNHDFNLDSVLADDNATLESRDLAVEEKDTNTIGRKRYLRKHDEQQMIESFSLGQYEEVLSQYEQHVESSGLPLSPLTLEIATESSLRLRKGNSSEAQSLLSNAQAAGMNVSCAMGPMLLHDMYHLHPADKKNADHLRERVHDYYRINEENGWPVRHHVGVSAANILIDSRNPAQGLNLLNTIYASHWTGSRAFDIVAMTVYVKGYAALKSLSGVEWSVLKVLKEDLRIDREFIFSLKHALSHFGDKAVKADPKLRRGFDDVQRIKVLRQMCIERRAEQKVKAKALGKNLVRLIAQCTKPEFKGQVATDPR